MEAVSRICTLRLLLRDLVLSLIKLLLQPLIVTPSVGKVL
jgi:hypothetical protein